MDININNKKYFLFLVSIFSFFLGYFSKDLLGGMWYSHERMEQNDIITYKYTNPHLECIGEQNGSRQLIAARSKINKYIRKETKKDSSLNIGVYARNLNTGAWFGIDEKKSFIPASLFKIPVMMLVLSKAEDDITILQRKITAPPEENYKSVDNLKDLDQRYRLKTGEEYTIDELLYRMIAYSDNHAYELIELDNSREEAVELMKELNFYLDYDNDGIYSLTAKEYSAILRALYNSTFFSRPVSEVALEYMSKSSYNEGLKKYLDEDIIVASKYGNYRLWEGNQEKKGFHECGIVYLDDPHVICALTSSENATVEDLAEIVSRIGEMVYVGVE